MMFGSTPTIPTATFNIEYGEPITDPLPPTGLTYNGVRLNPIGMSWSDISPSQGVFTGWSAFDSTAGAFNSAGKPIMYVVGNQYSGTWQGSPWSTPPSYVNSGNLVTQYAAWCDALLAHAGATLSKLNVWNEPEAASLITGQADPVGTLTTLAQTLFTKVQAYNSAHGTDIKVVGPTVSQAIDGSAGLSMLQQFLANGGGAYVDEIDFHLYVNGVQPELAIGVIKNVRDARDKYGLSTKPISITEVGIGSVNTPLSADRVSYRVKTAVWAAALGVDAIYAYAYNFTTYNLWDATNGINAEGVAWTEVCKWLTDTSRAGYSRSSSICYADFKRPGGYQARAIWTADRSTPSYAVPVWATQYHKTDGTVTTGLGGAGNVTLGFVPILLESGQAW